MQKQAWPNSLQEAHAKSIIDRVWLGLRTCRRWFSTSSVIATAATPPATTAATGTKIAAALAAESVPEPGAAH